MIEKLNIKNLLYVSGLALLLLFSPCSVRNHLQSALDIPQTEVHNVNKAVVNSTNCNVNSAETAAYTSSNIAFQSLKVLDNAGTSLPNIALYQQSNLSNSSENGEDTSLVPYYILFGKLKLHV